VTGNSMIATILQREPQNLRESIAVWRQLSDIVAQRGMQLNQAEIYQSLHALARLRLQVPENIRRDTALSVASHGRFAPLVAFYANDVISVAAAMLRRVQLPAEDWLALLPSTNDVARSILAGRSDLPEIVRRGLESLGAGVVALPSGARLPAAPVAYFADELQSMGGYAETPAETDNAITPAAADMQDTPQADWTKVEAFEAAPTVSILDAMLDDANPKLSEQSDKPSVTTPTSQISELVRRIDRFRSSRTKAPVIAQEQRDEIASIEASIRAQLGARAPEVSPQVSSAPVIEAPDKVQTFRAMAEPSSSPSPLGPADAAPPREATPPVELPDAGCAIPTDAPTSFRFETDADGIVDWAEGIALPLVIGLSISMAEPDCPIGVDDIAVDAFRQRSEILHARMTLGGQSSSAGEWRFCAEPMFDKAHGHFLGYHGAARRPMGHESDDSAPPSVDADDNIRQLIHELRSPLNAISGFAQIISGEMFGPVSGQFRDLANTIIDDAASVQAIIEDLDSATGDGVRARSAVDPADVSDISDVIDYVVNDLKMLLSEQCVGLSITREGGPFLARGDDANARRMIGRLLTALIDVSEPDSLIVGQLTADLTQDDRVQLRFVRPSAIRFADADELLDPDYSPDGDAPGADILSLGFSLRLVGSLASASGGRLEIAPNAIILHLPLATSDY
jgi:hypothetical protein